MFVSIACGSMQLFCLYPYPPPSFPSSPNYPSTLPYLILPTAAEILHAICGLVPLDTYSADGKIFVMKDKDTAKEADGATHDAFKRAAGDQWLRGDELTFLEKDGFHDAAKGAFFVIRCDDQHSVIIQKGVVQ